MAGNAGTPGKEPHPVTFAFNDRHVITTLALLASALFTFAARLRLNERPWGDEPHYLIMSIALGKYHTFDLTQAYENRDYWSFYPEQIDMHVFPNADGVMVPLHNFGGPLLWALPFTWWGRAGAAGVIVVASVLTIINIYWLLRELGIVKPYAGIVTALFIAGTPIYMYSSMQFIEPLGALLVVFAVRAVLMDRPTWVRLAIASAGLGYLPWIHGRFMIFTVLLGALLVARVDYRSWRAYLPAVAPMAVIFLALEVFNFVQYGSLSPAPGNEALGDGFLQIPPQTGVAGLLFDRQYGLLSHFPLLLLAVPGMLLAFKRRVTPRHLVLLGTIVVYLLAVSTFKTWWAGWSPPARLLAVLTPLFAYYLAVVLQRLHSLLANTVAVLAAMAGFLYSVTGDYYTFSRFVESGGAGNDPILRRIAEKLHFASLLDLLPSVRATPDTGLYGGWYFAFALFVGLVWLAGRKKPVARIPIDPLDTLFPVLNLVPVGGRLRRRVRSASVQSGVTRVSADEDIAPDERRADNSDGRRAGSRLVRREDEDPAAAPYDQEQERGA